MANDTPTYIGPDTYAYQDQSGNWRAGPNSQKFDSGSFVPESYAKSVKGSIDFRNRVKGLQDNPREETPDSYQEAQSIISQFNTLSDELNEAQEAENEERIEEIEQEIDDLRGSLGS